MPNLAWTHYRELLAVNEEKARYEGEEGKGNLSKLIIEIFLTDCTDYTDFHVADCNRPLHQELRKGLFISYWRSRRIIGWTIRMTS